MNRPAFWYGAALIGHLGLMALLLAWFAWLAPPVRFPVSLALAIALFPLLAPLRGLLHGRIYTHAWSNYLALPYFIHGVGEVWSNPAVRGLAAAEIVLSLLFFTGTLLYVRTAARARRNTPTA